MKNRSAINDFYSAVKKDRAAFISFWVIILLFLAAVFAPYLVPCSPVAINLDNIKSPPGLKHLFGTDSLGRDIFSRVLCGSRVSLTVGCVSTLLALLLGLIVGVAGGYFGGKIDLLVVGLNDLTLAFPGLLLAIGITAVFRGGIITILFALSIVGWAGFARIIRGEVIALKEKEYFEAARATGCSRLRIMVSHLIPNLAPTIVVLTALKIGGFILSEASLSFLGLGVEPPAPSWGMMISDGIEYIRSCPWMTVFPGLAILITVLSFNLLGDALRDFFDPRA